MLEALTMDRDRRGKRGSHFPRSQKGVAEPLQGVIIPCIHPNPRLRVRRSRSRWRPPWASPRPTTREWVESWRRRGFSTLPYARSVLPVSEINRARPSPPTFLLEELGQLQQRSTLSASGPGVRILAKGPRRRPFEPALDRRLLHVRAGAGRLSTLHTDSALPVGRVDGGRGTPLARPCIPRRQTAREVRAQSVSTFDGFSTHSGITSSLPARVPGSGDVAAHDENRRRPGRNKALRRRLPGVVSFPVGFPGAGLFQEHFVPGNLTQGGSVGSLQPGECLRECRREPARRSIAGCATLGTGFLGGGPRRRWGSVRVLSAGLSQLPL